MYRHKLVAVMHQSVSMKHWVLDVLRDPTVMTYTKLVPHVEIGLSRPCGEQRPNLPSPTDDLTLHEFVFTHVCIRLANYKTALQPFSRMTSTDELRGKLALITGASGG
jgi:hypothetical protein